MLTLQFYTRDTCSLCDSALAVVKRAQQRVAFRLEIISIEKNPELLQRYGQVIPVLAAGSIEFARSFFDEKSLTLALKKHTEIR